MVKVQNIHYDGHEFSFREVIGTYETKEKAMESAILAAEANEDDDREVIIPFEDFDCNDSYDVSHVKNVFAYAKDNSLGSADWCGMAWPYCLDGKTVYVDTENGAIKVSNWKSFLILEELFDRKYEHVETFMPMAWLKTKLKEWDEEAYSSARTLGIIG